MKTHIKFPLFKLLLAFACGIFTSSPVLKAQDAASAAAPPAPAPSVEELQTYAKFMETQDAAHFTVDNLWILIASFLVFIMHLGFSTLESGLCQKKNTVNILFKNAFIIAMGVLTYFFVGFNTHYPGAVKSDENPDGWNGYFHLGGPVTNSFDDEQNVAEDGKPTHKTEAFSNLTNEYASYTYWTDFLFQAMFAATAATIVSGAVAERVKLSAFLIHSTILVAIGYTVAGSWHWGTGWLSSLKSGAFYDFAGSTVVHAFGGFAALAFVLVLGPRKGKYGKDGSIKPIVAHNFPLAAIGVFLLFLGWFGFNGGSVLSADPAGVSLVCVTTALAACGGAIASIITSWVSLKKPDLSMALNGFLAGLVGITAGADAIAPMQSIIVGAIAGVIVVFSIIAIDRAKIDDPVGAVSVHGVCGVWGTLAVAIFGGANMQSQITGIVAVCAFAFVFSYALAVILKSVMGIRASEEEEHRGLDITEHGQEAYAG